MEENIIRELVMIQQEDESLLELKLEVVSKNKNLGFKLLDMFRQLKKQGLVKGTEQDFRKKVRNDGVLLEYRSQYYALIGLGNSYRKPYIISLEVAEDVKDYILELVGTGEGLKFIS